MMFGCPPFLRICSALLSTPYRSAKSDWFLKYLKKLRKMSGSRQADLYPFYSVDITLMGEELNIIKL